MTSDQSIADLNARALADPVLTQDEVCQLIQISLSTLYRMRRAGDGPAWIRVRGAIKYRRSAVEAYLADAEAANT